jgi:hypothetical protein
LLTPLTTPLLSYAELSQEATSTQQPPRIAVPTNWKAGPRSNFLSLIQTAPTNAPPATPLTPPLETTNNLKLAGLGLVSHSLFPQQYLSPVSAASDSSASPELAFSDFTPLLPNLPCDFPSPPPDSDAEDDDTDQPLRIHVPPEPTTQEDGTGCPPAIKNHVSYPSPPSSQDSLLSAKLRRQKLPVSGDDDEYEAGLDAAESDSDFDPCPDGTRSGPSRRLTRKTAVTSPRRNKVKRPERPPSKRPYRKNGRTIGVFPCTGCPSCDRLQAPKTFTRESDLARHLQKTRYVCAYCHESLSRPDALRRHERSCIAFRAAKRRTN